MTIDSKSAIKNPASRIPLLLRIVSIVILVEGLLGMLLFIAALIFQLNEQDFTGSMGLDGFSSNFYSFYIIIHIAIFSGLFLSGMFLLKLKKKGLYIFIISYLVLALINIYMNDAFGWTSIIIGFGFLAVLLYFKKRMI